MPGRQHKFHYLRFLLCHLDKKYNRGTTTIMSTVIANLNLRQLCNHAVEHTVVQRACDTFFILEVVVYRASIDIRYMSYIADRRIKIAFTAAQAKCCTEGLLVSVKLRLFKTMVNTESNVRSSQLLMRIYVPICNDLSVFGCSLCMNLFFQLNF